MAKNRTTKKAGNPPDQKHELAKAKARTRTKARAVCACSNCGKSNCGCAAPKLLPTDPGYVAARSKLSTVVVCHNRPERPPPRVTQPLVIPEFLQQLSVQVSSQAEIPLHKLVYRGRSTRMGAKSGKRKTQNAHCFAVQDPVTTQSDPEGEVRHLWHGTPLRNTHGILSAGLKASYHGMLGPGVYLGGPAKALTYAHKGDSEWGMMLYCRAALGWVGPSDTVDQVYDTIHCPAGAFSKAWSGWVHRGEWCIRDPKRVTILEIHIIPNPTFKVK